MPNGNDALTAAIREHTTRQYQRNPDPGTVVTVMHSLLRGLVDTIAGADRACIVVVANGAVTVPFATDATAVDLIRLERATGGGPCLSAAAHHRFGFGVPIDVDTITRWPALRRSMLDGAAARCVLPLHLYRTDQTQAALAVYSDSPGAFDDAAITVATTFATVIALAVHAEEREHQFKEALQSRDLLGQAKGILMERYSLDARAAFGMLKRISQDTNVKVVTLAERLVTSDHPPTSPDPA